MNSNVEVITPLPSGIPGDHLDRIAKLGDYNNQGVCGLYALAFILDKPVEKIRHGYKEMFGIVSPKWAGRTNFDKLRDMLEAFKAPFEMVDFNKGISLHRFCDEQNIDGYCYLVRVGNHFMVIGQGYAVDQYGLHQIRPKSAIGRRRVSHALKIDRNFVFGN